MSKGNEKINKQSPLFNKKSLWLCYNHNMVMVSYGYGYAKLNHLNEN